MTREAFDLSERFRVPVLVRLVTRLAHSRAVVRVRRRRPARSPCPRRRRRASWILLPGQRAAAVARRCSTASASSSSGRRPARGTTSG